jgi:LacI family transcriptional regulator
MPSKRYDEEGIALASITIRDVAARAGVALSTASLVLSGRGYVSEELTRRVRQAVAELGYRPNSVARSLRSQRTETIGVLITSIVSPFFPPVLQVIERNLAAGGLSVLFANTGENEATEAYLIDLMRHKRVDGLLVVPYSEANVPRLIEMRQEGLPVVTMHTDFAAGKLDCVAWDDFGGSFAVTSHLISQGCRRIAIFTSPSLVVGPRLLGYESALRQAGMNLCPELYLTAGKSGQGATLAQGNEATLTALRLPDPPDAIFVASSSYMVIGVLDAVQAVGKRIPDDVAVVAYDDYPWTDHLTPPISAVFRDIPSLGMASTELLLRRLRDPAIDQPETIRLPASLVVRASSQRKPPSRVRFDQEVKD